MDYKKQYKDLYLPKSVPSVIDVPSINFFMVDGMGAPDSAEYQNAISILYALTFTVKMARKWPVQPEGYFEYVVPPLEGLWWCEGGGFDLNRRDIWRWTAMIRQPEFVTHEVAWQAMRECAEKKPGLDITLARFTGFEEGLCVQMMHVGPYADEPETIAVLHDYIEAGGLRTDFSSARNHHEIYLSDPRKTAPEKLKTVIRLPVAKL